jgi:predicted RNA binding protein YcfA (HicA-like mRNA interferase family)
VRGPACPSAPEGVSIAFDGMKARDVLTLVARDGWYVARMRGSHQQFKHPKKPGLVTVAGRPSHDLALGTFNSILKQAGLK